MNEWISSWTKSCSSFSLSFLSILNVNSLPVTKSRYRGYRRIFTQLTPMHVKLGLHHFHPIIKDENIQWDCGKDSILYSHYYAHLIVNNQLEKVPCWVGQQTKTSPTSCYHSLTQERLIWMLSGNPLLRTNECSTDRSTLMKAVSLHLHISRMGLTLEWCEIIRKVGEEEVS